MSGSLQGEFWNLRGKFEVTEQRKKEEGIYCCEEMQKSWRKKDTRCVGALRLECQDSIYNLVYS